MLLAGTYTVVRFRYFLTRSLRAIIKVVRSHVMVGVLSQPSVQTKQGTPKHIMNDRPLNIRVPTALAAHKMTT